MIFWMCWYYTNRKLNLRQNVCISNADLTPKPKFSRDHTFYNSPIFCIMQCRTSTPFLSSIDNKIVFSEKLMVREKILTMQINHRVLKISCNFEFFAHFFKKNALYTHTKTQSPEIYIFIKRSRFYELFDV